jgi:eukaryotic-like serine/threonine-protein kinase
MDHLSPAIGGAELDSPRLANRLDSWKEIAAHFHRDVRTVRRWERTERLPVHRHVHRSRGSVYAFPDELDRWWAGRSAPPAPPVRVPSRGRLVAAIVASSLVLAALVLVLHGTADTSTNPALLDPQVQEAYLVARHQLSRRTGDWDKARERLQFVVDRAPGFPEAHALLGETFVRQALYDPPARAASWATADAAARRALALDANVAEAHTLLGRISLLRDWNWAKADAETARAVELAPRDPEARSTRAHYLSFAGHLDEAIAERQRVHQNDPLNPQWLVYLGEEYALARRYEDADRSFLRALELEHDYRPAVGGLADVADRAGRPADASDWRLRHLRLGGRDDVAAAYEEVCRRDGPLAAERWLDRRRLAQLSRDSRSSPFNVAYYYARLGDREQALHFLELAYERRDAGLLRARLDPDLDLVRDDARFQDLLRRVGPPRQGSR